MLLSSMCDAKLFLDFFSQAALFCSLAESDAHERPSRGELRGSSVAAVLSDSEYHANKTLI